jgi:hypothetical protein
VTPPAAAEIEFTEIKLNPPTVVEETKLFALFDASALVIKYSRVITPPSGIFLPRVSSPK